MSRCIITGGAGFIGGHLARRLIREGHAVTVIDSLWNSTRERIPKNCDFAMADIRGLSPSYFDKFDVVFHLAAVSRTPPAVNRPEECVSVNVMGTVRILEAARFARVPRLVFSSSNVVYAADTAYKMSKLAGEMLCDTYSNLYGVSTVKLRYSNVYGSGMMKGDLAVFAALRDSKKVDGCIKITGDGRQSRDFTHVDDIVEANILAWKSDYVGGALDICTGRNLTMNEVAPLFECPVEYVGERLGDVKHIIQNPAKAMEAIGWKSTIIFENGFSSIWNTSHESQERR